jgi:peroxiredoxin Q/BCP
MLQPGDEAPDFAVGPTTLHKMLDASAVLIFFFPKAFTPGCTREAKGFCQKHDGLVAAGCAVVGVSSDDQTTQDSFRGSLQLPYPLVGDPGGRIASAYGVRWPLIGLARRASFLVGRDRKIQAAFWSEFDSDAHVTKALEAARSLSR